MINTARKYRLRRVAALMLLIALLAVISLVAAWVYGFVKEEKSAVPIPEPMMPPVSAEGFNAENLISETEFTRWDSLSARQIQAFISDWGHGCRPGKAKSMPENTGIAKEDIGSEKSLVSVPCLKDFRGRLAPRDADRYCPQALQGGGDLNVGEIIAQVSHSCQINPKVILVTLQKEQGLLTASSARLRPSRYQIAMGYGCPDHKLCDSEFFGFGTQVYYAARQLRRYQVDPQEYLVQAGKSATLGFGPDSRCNRGEIVAQNWPTAALYNYTPYLASEDALAGLSHECAQAGNLNFYKFYKAWFGDPVNGNGELLTRKALSRRQEQQKAKSAN
ncbi:hypothetical protein [Varibaculum vaginae]|uniref:hypothetical protein n=1 Tax=Varibaculum vaginae TaxID=2364797 RepID=UPI000F091D98|nr:hypothetical protein [Varibaculum vaginae]